jgi:hypothetical protein
MSREERLNAAADAGAANLPPDDFADQAPPEPGQEGTPPSKEPTVEELRAQMKALSDEMEGIKQQFQRDYSQAQNDVAYYKGLAERRVGPGPEPEARPEEPGIGETEFYQNPVEATRKVFQTEFEKRRQEAAQQAMAYRVNEMKIAYEAGRDTAMRKYPVLFKGIEKQVEDMMFEAFRQGQIVDPRRMGSEESWTYAAEAIRRSKGELDFSKYYQPRSPVPQAEPFSETPTGTRYGQRTGGPVYDDEAELFLRAINRGEKKPLTKEEIAKEYEQRTMPRRIQR